MHICKTNMIKLYPRRSLLLHQRPSQHPEPQVLEAAAQWGAGKLEKVEEKANKGLVSYTTTKQIAPADAQTQEHTEIGLYGVFHVGGLSFL